MIRGFVRHVVFFSVLLSLYIMSHGALLRYSDTHQNSGQAGGGIWNLPPIALQVIAGEFKGVFADYLTLEAGAQLGTDVRRDPAGGFRVIEKKLNWDGIHRIFVASQTLDPSFAQTYIIAQGWLPWDADMIKETQQILQTANENRLWDWQPLHFMGFNTYFFLNDPGKAGKIFLQAANRPNAPMFLAIVGARLAQKGGETKAAIMLMKSMLVDMAATDLEYKKIADRLQALEGTFILEKAVKKYREQSASLPAALSDLVSQGLLSELPSNPYDVDYCIDHKGKVFFDDLGCVLQSSQPSISAPQ